MKSPPPRTSELFVNRDKPIALFESSISNIDPDRARQLLIFHGVGGQGKTHLCRHLSEKLRIQSSESASKLHWGVVYLQEHPERQAEYFLFWVRNALKTASKISFPAFDLAFELFWMELHGNEPRPYIMVSPWWEDISSEIGPAIEQVSADLLQSVPFVGSILGRLSRQLFKWANKEILLRTNAALASLYAGGKLLPAHEIKRQLPSILAGDLAAWRNDRPSDRFVVMVDEYESALDASGAGSPFRTNDFDDAVRELAERCQATLFVLFSREELKWGDFDKKWSRILDDRHHLLGGLAKSDAERFLDRAGVDEADVRAAMIDGSSVHDGTSNEASCFPIMLEMQVGLYRSLGADGEPFSADDFQIDGDSFAVMLPRLLGRLLGRYPPPLQYTLRRLAATRRFDESVYKFVIEEFLTYLPGDAWSQLRALSLVHQGEAEGVYKFHNVIREGLLATLDSEKTRETHNSLFKYFKRAMAPPTGEKIGAAQAGAAAEAFHHCACVDPKAANTWWAEAEIAFRGSLLDRFVEDIDRASVALAAQAFGERSLEHAERLFALGRNLDAQGRYVDAEAWYRRALSIMEDAGAGATLSVANVLQSLGIALDFQSKHGEAHDFLKKSLDILRGILKPDDDRIAMSLTAIGTNLTHQGLYDDAEKLIREALSIMGENDRGAATIHHNLGLCLGYQGRLPEAEEEHSKGLELRERTVGSDHHRTGHSLSYLGFILDRRKKYSEAEVVIGRALEIAKATYGLEHRETADYFDELGRTLYNQSRFEEAEQQHRHALAIRERALGPAHPDTAESVAHIGWTMYGAGKYGEAVPYLRRAREIAETVLGPEHRDTRKIAERLLQAERRALGLKLSIVICASSEIETYAPADFSHVVSILDPVAAEPIWAEGWDSVRKLVLRFHDATTVLPSAVMFGPEHLEALLAFVDKEPTVDAGALLVHGTLGISRSSACAAILQAHLAPHLAGVDLFREVLRTRDIAWPNLHVVELGDARLARSGDLIAGANAVYRYQLLKHPEWKESQTRAGRGREVEAAAKGAEISL
jgi:predicted protein tyrosine phosphatase/tetratricopeptide (TPR) repeat protein